MPGGKYKCPDCDIFFSSPQICREHRINVHRTFQSPDRKYVCSECPTGFFTPFGLKNHTKIYHSQSNNHICPTCNAVFGYKSSLENHKRIHEKAHTCNQCGKSFNTLFDIYIHGTTFHKYGNVPKCDICGTELYTVLYLRKHTKDKHHDKMRIIEEIGQQYSKIPSTTNPANKDISDPLVLRDNSEDNFEISEDEICASAIGTDVLLQMESTQQYDFYDQKSNAAQFQQYKIPESADNEQAYGNIYPERTIPIDDLPDSVIPLGISNEYFELLKDDVMKPTKEMHQDIFDSAQFHEYKIPQRVDNEQDYTNIYTERMTSIDELPGSLISPSNDDFAMETDIYVGKQTASSREHNFSGSTFNQSSYNNSQVSHLHRPSSAVDEQGTSDVRNNLYHTDQTDTPLVTHIYCETPMCFPPQHMSNPERDAIHSSVMDDMTPSAKRSENK